MSSSRLGVVFASVLVALIVGGARAAAAPTDVQLAESAALQSIFCENMTSGSSQRVWETMLDCSPLLPAGIRPAGCLAKTVSGHTVSLTFTDCKIPHSSSSTTGLGIPGESVTGSVDAVFKKDAAGLHVHTTGTGVKIGSATLGVDDTTTYHWAAHVETVSVSHSMTGVDALGHSVSNTGSFTSADASYTGCLTLNGTWKLTNNGLASSVAATNVKRCHKADGTWGCPSGSIAMMKSHTTVATYNGTSIFTLTLPNGNKEQVNVPCVP